MKDRYIGTAEIITCLGCGRTFANDLMHKFEARGQAYKIGRLYKVKEKVFADWLEYECRQPGIQERRRAYK